MALSNAEKQARLRENNAKRGLVQVKLWIPEDRREELHKLAEKWRKKAQK